MPKFLNLSRVKVTFCSVLAPNPQNSTNRFGRCRRRRNRNRGRRVGTIAITPTNKQSHACRAAVSESEC